ncbi:MAG TPA: C4-type zinc ribbon domain-containing protein [Acidimicrobiales bacterium]
MTTGEGAPESGHEEPEAPVRPLARLLEVQDHDTVVGQIRHRRATLSERGELANVDGQLGVLEIRTKELALQRDELGDRQGVLEHQIDASRTRRDTLEKRLFGGQVVASRELQAMNEEVKHLARHISELEDREIEVMEALEPVDRELAAGDVTRHTLEADAERLRAVIAQSEQALDTELAEQNRARAAAASGVRDDLLARYEQLRAKLGGTGAARLAGGSCSGCHLTLSSMELDRVRKAPPEAVITCEQCGRILVP